MHIIGGARVCVALLQFCLSHLDAPTFDTGAANAPQRDAADWEWLRNVLASIESPSQLAARLCEQAAAPPMSAMPLTPTSWRRRWRSCRSTARTSIRPVYVGQAGGRRPRAPAGAK